MMNHQDVFISGASWACAKSRFPLLSFDRFWWAKVGLYDKKNQEALVLAKCRSHGSLVGADAFQFGGCFGGG